MKDYDFYCIEATIIETSNIPLLPERIENKLMFRTGQKRVMMFKEEVDYLLELGQIEILTVHKSFYGQQDYFFKEYIHKCYHLRKNTDKPFYNLLFKLVMNSAYGKYAEKNMKDSIAIKKLEDMTKQDFYNSYEEIDGNFIIRQEKFVHLDLNVPIACKITALSRLVLHKHMMQVLKSQGKIIYCDTDSIFTDKPILETDEELGGMKLEAEIEKLVCLNAKEYAYDTMTKGRIKMKGFINREGSVEEFLRIYLEPFEITRKTTFKESLKKYNEDNEYFRFVELKLKQKKTFYCKRVIMDDLSTRPLTTDELPSEVEEANKQKVLGVLLKCQNI